MNFSVLKKGREFQVIVDEDFPISEISNVRIVITVSKSGKEKPYCYLIGKNKNTYLHRFLTNAPKGLVVDHINGNSLDNRLSNLRVCTHKENIRNMKKEDRGISFCIERQKWVALIMVDGRGKFLGRFKDKQQALEAYAIASKRFHKNFGGQ